MTEAQRLTARALGVSLSDQTAAYALVDKTGAAIKAAIDVGMAVQSGYGAYQALRWGVGAFRAWRAAKLSQAASKAVGAVDDAAGAAQGLTNAEVRLWYNSQLKLLNTAVTFTRKNAMVLHAQRNALKVQARKMMADRNAAAQLDKTDPIRPFQYYVEKYSAQGYSGKDLWQKIIQGSSTPNAGTNAKFGIE